MKPESSLPHLQQPATCPYRKPLDPVQPPPPHFLKCMLILSPIYIWVSPVVSFPQVSPPKPCIQLYSPSTRATCPTHLILLDFISRTILSEQYRSLSSSLCSFLHSLVTSYHLGPNILLSTLFSSILSQSYSLKASDQVSHPYKTTSDYFLKQN